MEEDKKPNEIILKCDCQMEMVTLTQDDEYDDTIFMNVYRMYDHDQTWKSKWKDIWKILIGKQILGYDFVLSKKDLKTKINQL